MAEGRDTAGPGGGLGAAALRMEQMRQHSAPELPQPPASSGPGAAPGLATPPPVRSGYAMEQHGRSVGSTRSTSPPGGKRLAADLRRMASRARNPHAYDVGSAAGSFDPSYWASCSPGPGSSSALGMSLSGLRQESAMEANSLVACNSSIIAASSSSSPHHIAAIVNTSVGRLQRQHEADRRNIDRRLEQLEQCVKALQGERSRDAELRKKIAEANGSLAGLQEEHRLVAGHMEELEKKVLPRMSALDMMRQRFNDMDQQVHGLELRTRHVETFQKEAERNLQDMQALESFLEETAQRLSRLEEMAERNQASLTSTELTAQGDHYVQDLQYLHGRVDLLERQAACQDFPDLRSSQTASDISRLQADLYYVQEKVGHLTHKAKSSEDSQASMHQSLTEILDRLAAMDEGGLPHQNGDEKSRLEAKVDATIVDLTAVWEWITAQEKSAAEEPPPSQPQQQQQPVAVRQASIEGGEQCLEMVPQEGAAAASAIADEMNGLHDLRLHLDELVRYVDETVSRQETIFSEKVDKVQADLVRTFVDCVSKDCQQDPVLQPQPIDGSQPLDDRPRANSGDIALELPLVLQGMQEDVQMLRQQLLHVQARVDEFVPMTSLQLQETLASISNKLHGGSGDILLSGLEEKSPLEIDIALEHLQVACLDAANEIASAVRLELQDLQDAAFLDGSVNQSIEGNSSWNHHARHEESGR